MNDIFIQEIVEQCKRLVIRPEARNEYLLSRKDRRQGFIGYFSNYIPEEIVAAAGFHPLRIIGRYDTSDHQGQSIYTPACSFVRDIYAAAESGAFSDFACVIFPNSCDSLKVLQQMFEFNIKHPPAYTLLHPVKADHSAVQYFAEQIKTLADHLKKESGLDFTDAQLADVIGQYNQTRQLLRQIYTFSQANPAVMKGSDRAALVTAAMIMDRDQYNQMLKQIVTEGFAAGPSEARPVKRIMVMGPLVDNLDLLETIEQAGALIVDDDITNGTRYFDRDVDLDGDLYENLAKRYLLSGPSPTLSTDVNQDEQAFRQRIEALAPDGIIYINQKFCEPHVHNYLEKSQILKQLNVNTLMLEVEHDNSTVSERDLLRIESFIEMAGES